MRPPVKWWPPLGPLWKRAALDLSNQVAELREQLRDAETAALDGQARAERLEYAIDGLRSRVRSAEKEAAGAGLCARDWQARAEKAEKAEAELVERLAQIAEQSTPGIVDPAGQCRWVGLATGERCGYRDGHRGKCVDSAGRFLAGPFTATRLAS